ncbi:putative UDP-glucuronate 4-epimerase [Helianthus anomalus]
MFITNWGSPVGHRHPPLPRGTGFKSWEWHMSPRVRTWHGEVTAELAWSGSGSRSEITPGSGSRCKITPATEYRKWWEEKGVAQFRIFNLGNTSPVPVSDLVSILEKLLKVKAKRRVMKLTRNGDVPFTHANISLAQREFGYKPTTDLQTGLKKFVRWYEKYYGSGKKSDH